MASNKVETKILEGYTKTASALLQNYYPDNFDSADVTKLAEYLIEEDINRAALVKKAALYEQAGRTLCLNMLNNNAQEENALYGELEKSASFNKEGKLYLGPMVAKLKDMIGAGKTSIGKATDWLSTKAKIGKQKASELINAAKVRLDPNVTAVGDDFIMYGPGKAAPKGPLGGTSGPIVPFVDDGAKVLTGGGVGSTTYQPSALALGLGAAGAGGLGYYMGTPSEEDKRRYAYEAMQGGMV
tara:strand:+ start:1520 stop:2245 length:726 start_codon:yes stop_codon:yes gene_type:complete